MRYSSFNTREGRVTVGKRLDNGVHDRIRRFAEFFELPEQMLRGWWGIAEEATIGFAIATAMVYAGASAHLEASEYTRDTPTLDPTKTVWEEVSGGEENIQIGSRTRNARAYAAKRTGNAGS